MNENRFRRIAPAAAGVILVGFALLVLFGLTYGATPLPETLNSPHAGSDTRLYTAIVERLRAGTPYYQAVGEELRTRGYATRPFFNWRLPTLAWVMMSVSPANAHILLVGLALGTLFLWVLVIRRTVGRLQGSVAALVLMLCGPAPLALNGPAPFFHEMWAGMLIAFSLAAYGLGRPWLSAASGLTALFVRELSLPYAGIMALLAMREGRWREAAVWLGGIGVFFGVLWVHASTIAPLLGPTDQTNVTWIQFGGWPFVLSAARWSVFSFVTPEAVTAILLPAAFLGLAGWGGPLGTRVGLTVAAFAAAFCIAGRPDNYYWGLMDAPLVPLGLLFTPASLSALWARIRSV